MTPPSSPPASMIIAGSGETSLWGGSGEFNDVLYGGAGKDTFYYAFGNGNDTINGAASGDVVNIAADIENLYAEVVDNAVVINFKDGGKLTVNDGVAAEYVIQGAGTYNLDRNNTWIKRL